jgi:hypothetical protein
MAMAAMAMAMAMSMTMEKTMVTNMAPKKIAYPERRPTTRDIEEIER